MSSLDIPRFQGGQKLMTVSAAIGAIGTALSVVGFFVSPQRAFFGYLFGYSYWVGIALAALILLAIFHAVGAKWSVVIRRPLEAMASTIPVFLVLFIPIALGMKHLYVWVSPDTAAVSEHTRHLLHHKHAYLNVPFFLIRAGVYFFTWIVVSWLLSSWSRKQDDTRDAGLTVKQRRLGTGALPALAITVTFASVDWLMSLDPAWFSTIFGVYFFAGGFVSTVAVLTLGATYSTSPAGYGSRVTPQHFHNLGKLLLAFTAFWAYIAFSQYLIIWIANVPEETPWYLVRTTGGWKGWATALVFGHFVLPFTLLLSQRLKLQPRKLSWIAFWVLLVHILDVYWIVMPVLHADGPHLHWTDLTSLLGVGGFAVAFGVFRLRGQYAIPVGDPFLADSLRYTQP